jgi:outer membrane protein assembly factor BamE
MKSPVQTCVNVNFMAGSSRLGPFEGLKVGVMSLLCVVLSSCAWIDQPLGYVARSINPYRFELIQGNVITKEQLEVLRPGMSKNQVKEVLGTPLISSLFHEERWDYAFTVRRAGQEIQKKKLAVFFVKEELLRFESDALPSEVEFAATIDIRRPSLSKLPAMQATPEQLAGFKSSKPTGQDDATLGGGQSGVVRSNYPPLEPN